MSRAAKVRSELFRPLTIDSLAKTLVPDDAQSIPDVPDGQRVTKCPKCGFVGPAEAVRRHRERAGHDEEAPDAEADVQLGVVQKASRPEQRFTFGPLYSPGVLDAHSEWCTADDLQEAAHNYFRNGDRKLRKQHGSQVIGEVVEMASWPFDHEAELIQADGSLRKQKLPAGTVYCGVVWSPSAWQDVKAGRITGLSIGGSTVRVKADLPR